MADLTWFDGLYDNFDYRWTVTGGVANITSNGPNGRPCVEVEGGTRIEREAPDTIYCTVGFEVYFDSATSPASAQAGTIVEFYDSAQSGIMLILSWKTDASGDAESEGAYLNLGYMPTSLIVDDDHFFLGSTTSNRLQLDRWYFIELHLYILNSSGGIIRLTVDDEAWVDEFDIYTTDTLTYGVAPDTIRFGATSRSTVPTMRLGSMYCIEASTTKRLGVCRVEELTPTADATSSDFIPSANPNHYANVDDPSPGDDADATRLVSYTAGDKETYTTSSTFSSNADMLAVEVSAVMYDPDATAATARVTVKSGTTTGNGTTTDVPDAGYGNISHIWETNPDTAAAWTQAEVEAAEFGVERIA